MNSKYFNMLTDVYIGIFDGATLVSIVLAPHKRTGAFDDYIECWEYIRKNNLPSNYGAVEIYREQ